MIRSAAAAAALVLCGLALSAPASPRRNGRFFAVFGAGARVAGRAAATRAARGMVL